MVSAEGLTAPQRLQTGDCSKTSIPHCKQRHDWGMKGSDDFFVEPNRVRMNQAIRSQVPCPTKTMKASTMARMINISIGVPRRAQRSDYVLKMMMRRRV